MTATEDRQIISLLECRDEAALKALTAQYGKLGKSIAGQILGNDEDAEEVWNDALMQLWNAIPPAKPENLRAYLVTVVRRLAYDRIDRANAKKRGGGTPAVSLETLTEAQHPAVREVEELFDAACLNDAVNRFLGTLSDDACTIFVQRYGNDRTVAESAEMYQISRNKTALSLMRTRIKLKKFLREEGFL